MSNTILTGIKPTGVPHMGNYFGTFEPAIRRAGEFDQSFLFIANSHALNQVQDAGTLLENTLSIAATWLACGLDVNQTHLYAQSDIPEVFELETMLTSFTPKGWMNKAHAYKAAVDQNSGKGQPDDDGVGMGLYTYPILMAADILIFQANTIPVGKDQVQHVEIARDIGQRINNHYQQELFVLPEHKIEEDIGTIPGADGRKMSKSYNNVIPLFSSAEDRQKAVNKIVTDSSAPEDKKEVADTPLLGLFKLVSTPEQTNAFQTDLETGKLGWGDAKKQLAEKMEAKFSDMTEEYNRLMANTDEIRSILSATAEKIRPQAQDTIAKLRQAMGII